MQKKKETLTRNDWVKISDQRPPFMEMVICWDGVNVWPGWDENAPEEHCYMCCADPGMARDCNEATHWMLLPEGPK